MERARHLLIVDDDQEILTLLHDFLVRHGFRVSTAADGREMRRVLAQWTVDLIILDMMLPGEDGIALCRALRADSSIPIVFLTAVADETDRIIGLELGADDYLIKPFNPRELLARIRAILRRVGGAGDKAAEKGTDRWADRWADRGGAAAERPPVYRFAGWELDVGSRELRAADGTLVHLSSGEFSLLQTFLDHPQQVVKREELLEQHRGDAITPFDRSIDIQISRLRKKIEPSSKDPALIKTIRGVGYQLTVPVSRDAPSGAGL